MKRIFSPIGAILILSNWLKGRLPAIASLNTNLRLFPDSRHIPRPALAPVTAPTRFDSALPWQNPQQGVRQ
jgi:hypothetical protein